MPVLRNRGFSGMVVGVYVDEGQAIAAGSPVVRLTEPCHWQSKVGSERGRTRLLQRHVPRPLHCQYAGFAAAAQERDRLAPSRRENSSLKLHT